MNNKKHRAGSMVHLLAELDYPTGHVTAAVKWEIEPASARRRLMSAVAQGYLFREGKHYFSPTPELLQAWLAEGVLI